MSKKCHLRTIRLRIPYHVSALLMIKYEHICILGVMLLIEQTYLMIKMPSPVAFCRDIDHALHINIIFPLKMLVVRRSLCQLHWRKCRWNSIYNMYLTDISNIKCIKHHINEELSRIRYVKKCHLRTIRLRIPYHVSTLLMMKYEHKYVLWVMLWTKQANLIIRMPSPVIFCWNTDNTLHTKYYISVENITGERHMSIILKHI